MKKLILMCSVIGLIVFAACDRNATNQDFKYEIAEFDGRVVTEAEKSRNYEKNLIKRLQDTIEMFDNVDEAVISIDSTNETEKAVDVRVATKQNMHLTDEQKTGIANLIINSVSSDSTVTVNIIEENP